MSIDPLTVAVDTVRTDEGGCKMVARLRFCKEDSRQTVAIWNRELRTLTPCFDDGTVVSKNDFGIKAGVFSDANDARSYCERQITECLQKTRSRFLRYAHRFNEIASDLCDLHGSLSDRTKELGAYRESAIQNFLPLSETLLDYIAKARTHVCDAEANAEEANGIFTDELKPFLQEDKIE